MKPTTRRQPTNGVKGGHPIRLMDKIKFNNQYPKLHGQKTAILLDVILVDREFLSYDFLEYDLTTTNGTKYAISPGTLIHLTFRGDKLIPFCTLRRYTKAKYEYYTDLLFKEFEIILKIHGNTKTTK